jgi:hypothetical protein
MTVLFMKNKNQAETKVLDHVGWLERQYGFKLKWIRVDEGGEYLSSRLKSALAEKGIELRTTAPYSPSQNGVAERLNRTLVELARAMLAEKNLPKSLWEWAVTHAAYIRNRSPTKALPNGITPHEAFTKEKPNVSHFQEFGAPVWIFREDVKSLSKLDERAIKHIFCGHLDGPKAVRYYDAKTHRVKISRNFRFTDPSTKFTEILMDAPSEGENNGSTNGTSAKPPSTPQKPTQNVPGASDPPAAPSTPPPAPPPSSERTPKPKAPPSAPTTPRIETEPDPKVNPLNPIPLRRKLTRNVPDHNYLKLGNPAARREQAHCPNREQPEANPVAEDEDEDANPIANFVQWCSNVLHAAVWACLCTKLLQIKSHHGS